MNAHEQWLKERRLGIGGSDAAAVLGLSKWKTPYDVYADKLGLADPIPDNEAMLWGRLQEPLIRQQYADRTGRAVTVPNAPLVHPVHAFMRANLDGATDDKRVFEAKTARTAQDWGEPGTDEVPQPYLLQVQHYMAVAGFVVADVAVLIGGSDFRIYEVPADPELQEMMIEAEAAFWDRVQRRDPPEPVTLADAQARFGRSSRAGVVVATEAVEEAVHRLLAIKAQIKGLEGDEGDAKAIVMSALGEMDTLASPGGQVLVTWKAAKAAQRFDAKALQAAHPDLYAQFLKTGEPSRRLLIK